MKTFYTERDIEEMHARGVSHIEINDNVVITDVARERAEKLGVLLVAAGQKPPASSSPGAKPASNLSQTELVSLVKARVIARLGTSEHDSLLDQIIPQVIARLNGSTSSSATGPKPQPKSDY